MGHDATIRLPHVPGHEFAGTIVALGDGVEGITVGDRVTVPFVLGCGRCGECASGNQQICDNQYQPGFSDWGAFAQYVALPYAEENLVRLPVGMSFEAAAGLGCRFATAYRAVVDQGAVSEGDTLAVWGCGGVGLSAVMVGVAMGATVVAIDIDEKVLAFARTLGASHCLVSTEESNDVESVRELCNGGADVSIDALGSSVTAIASMRSLRKRGRHIQVGLMIGDAENPEIPMDLLHSREISMHGVHGMQAWQYRPMLELVAEGAISPEGLVTKTVGLREGVDHLMAMGSYPGIGLTVVNDFTDKDR
jgi:alcohol dehydrogenase